MDDKMKRLFWIAAGVGGCANCLEIGDDPKAIVKRLRKLENELMQIIKENC